MVSDGRLAFRRHGKCTSVTPSRISNSCTSLSTWLRTRCPHMMSDSSDMGTPGTRRYIYFYMNAFWHKEIFLGTYLAEFSRTHTEFCSSPLKGCSADFEMEKCRFKQKCSACRLLLSSKECTWQLTDVFYVNVDSWMFVHHLNYFSYHELTLAVVAVETYFNRLHTELYIVQCSVEGNRS